MPSQVTDPLDRRILQAVQRAVPLVREPFEQLAGLVGCSEERLLDRLRALSGQGGPIREISGTFECTRLGYRQALIAFAVAEDDLQRAGAAAAEHPGVSHCYARAGRYNLWFTLAVSGESALGLEGTVRVLAGRCRAAASMLLPARARYKLDAAVDANLDDGAIGFPRQQTAGVWQPGAAGGAALSDEQVRAVRALQLDLPRRKDPFAVVAASEAMDADMLLVHAADFLGAALMRRYSAVLRHRQAGLQANVLVAWQVSEALADAAGAACAGLPAVSHCFLRATCEDWPYNLYTMIHGRREKDCLAAIRQIVALTGLQHYQALWTVAEYKKKRVPLFGPQEAAWEAAQRNAG